jgi:hypothetical protein
VRAPRRAFAATAGFLVPLLAAALAARAESLRWGDLDIPYAIDQWEVSPSDAGDSVVLICIASACSGRPVLYAIAAPASDSAADLPSFERDSIALPLPPDSSALSHPGFAAVSRWSGCRAMDVPILEATAIRAGIAYRITSALLEGCQFGSAMPQQMFIDLVAGITVAPVR